MGFFKIDQLGTIHFHEYGEGTKPMLAFHGYGMTGNQFHVLKNSVLKEYRIYGFDHFFHGHSHLENWTEADILNGMPKTLVRQYVNEWFKMFGRQRFSVMGYSIGANIALILVEEYSDLIDAIVLMAPDGLSVYKGFDILRNRGWGKLLFSRATKSKWLAPAVLKLARNIRFIDDSLYKVAYNEIADKQKRLDVYYTLNIIKLLVPDIVKIAGLINEHNIPCTLVFGKHDKLFPIESGRPFIKLLNNAQLHHLDMGHWLITAALDDYLTKFENDTRPPRYIIQ